MRFPKPWSKKRGSRLTGRGLAATVGEAAFFATLFLVGVFILSLTLAQRFVAGPWPPLATGLGFWIFVALATAMIVVGGAALILGVLQIGASSERRSVLAQRAEELELIGRPVAEFPAVPTGMRMTDSPGMQLNFRLPTTSWPGKRLAAAAALALMWNAVWMVLLVVVIAGFWSDRPRWVLAGLLFPLAMIGIWVLRYYAKCLKRTSGVGATIVEIDEHPLQPGGTYRAYAAQLGRMKLRKIQIELICEEESTFRQGTDIRVDRNRVLSEIILDQYDLTIDLGRPWEQEFELKIPATAMHSFRSSHNAVHWKVIVSGEARPWPSFCQSFPVVVQPAAHPPKRNPR
ncbi:hypothetical protein FF011L_42220 [Roseimaritima multifibrata]|uniref:Uncharacterized protein n=1 Tax=Roseimaritima multifibrata TaxID=1930274 RepID=A0A517MKL1_9BACT|nr:hypothetical protein [Roseimaritima multifibrata]QDS95426.1 hypothetical protein FF011L_42220 [Roseimaritima multifibrata]